MNKIPTLVLAALLLGGCLSPRPVIPIALYTLDPPLVVQQAPAGPQLTVGMRPLSTVDPYKKKMAFLTGEHQLGFRLLEEWAAPPEQVVTTAILDALSGTGFFLDAGDAINMAHPDLMLTGQLRKFYEDRTVSPPAATLEVSLHLREARGEQQLLGEILRIREPMAGDTAADFAAAMNAALSKLAATAAERVVAAAAQGATGLNPSSVTGSAM